MTIEDETVRPATSRPKRYALVGTGSRAGMYINALLTSHADVGRLVAVADPNPIRMGHYTTLVNAAGAPPVAEYAATEFERMISEQRPDAVIVTSPDYSHVDYICAALDHGLDVITEKPLTTDADKIRRIVASVEKSSGNLTVTFNYRYSPRNSVVKQLITDGAIGDITSVHFEWVLDTNHGADYFRRWHRNKENSGGLLVHKSSHHFDLVNWWLADVPKTVFALGGLKFYGDENARARGLGARPELSRDSDPATDPFRLDLSADPKLRTLYLEAESADGYHRDLDVFGPGITIEDNLNLVVGYRRGAAMSYTLNAHSPWEGYRIGFNGTEGRLELEVIERASVAQLSAVDPSALAKSDQTSDSDDLRQVGERVVLQRHWEAAQSVPIPEGVGGHGGGDRMLLDDIFRGPSEDPLGRPAGYLDGIRSILVGVSGNQSLATGDVVHLDDFGIALTAEDQKLVSGHL